MGKIKAMGDRGKTYLVGLDLLRVIAALMVFCFQCQMHLGCSFGVLNDFIQMGAVFMTAFFILSGYCLYIAYNRKNLSDIKEIGKFYRKRFVSIFPLYYVVAVSFTLFLSEESILRVVALAPIQFLGIQSVFSSLFPFSHNGGTWFQSCLIICYLIYPYLQEIMKQISVENRWSLFLLLCAVILYSPIVVRLFNIANIYSNPFFRLCEFLVGVVLGALKESIESSCRFKFLHRRYALGIELVILVFAISAAMQADIAVNDYMLYNWIALPAFVCMTVTCVGIKFDNPCIVKILHWLSSASYAFFLAQFFTWKLSLLLFRKIGITGNVAKIVLSFLICVAITFVLHEMVEKKVAQCLK